MTPLGSGTCVCVRRPGRLVWVYKSMDVIWGLAPQKVLACGIGPPLGIYALPPLPAQREIPDQKRNMQPRAQGKQCRRRGHGSRPPVSWSHHATHCCELIPFCCAPFDGQAKRKQDQPAPRPWSGASLRNPGLGLRIPAQQSRPRPMGYPRSWPVRDSLAEARKFLSCRLFVNTLSLPSSHSNATPQNALVQSMARCPCPLLEGECCKIDIAVRLRVVVALLRCDGLLWF